MIRSITFVLCFLLFSQTLYGASPRTNYLLYCSGCHRPTGEGKAPNVPTLLNELGRMMSVEEMRGYLVRIPGASQAPINDEELADVINWVLLEFNSETLPENFRELSYDEVSDARKNVLADPLKYRIQYWKDYEE